MSILDRFTRKNEAETLNKLVETQTQRLEEFGNALAVSNEVARRATLELESLKEKETWVKLGASDDNRELGKDELDKIREMAVNVYYKTPEGKAIIRNLVTYIVGTGVDYEAQDENGDVQKYLDEWVKSPLVRFDRRQISIVRRVLRDGEAFLHKMYDKQGFCYALRFYPPGEITEVNTDPNDAEVVKSYTRKWQDENGEQHEEGIKAEEIQHIKFDVDEDVSRGRPLLENVLKRITQHEDWLNGRIITNKAKSSYFLERIVDGPPGRVASVAASMPSAASSRFDNDSYATQAPRYGSVVTHSKSVEYKWVNPVINAADVAEDGRQIRLSIAAGVQLPEYLLTSDASNQNYSSSMVAESPFVKAIEGLRMFFEQEFKALLGDVLKRAIAGGRLPAMSTETVLTESAKKKMRHFKLLGLKEQVGNIAKDDENFTEEEVPTKTEVDFEWPSIITRNLWEETQAVDTWYSNKWVSRSTAQMRFGLDPDEEQRKIDKDREENPEDAPYSMAKDEETKLEIASKYEKGNEEKEKEED